MAEGLVQITRGNLTENIIRGDIVVLDQNGHLNAVCGNSQKKAYLRSAAKPIQAIVAVREGVLEYFDITDEELAVMCASHIAEEVHIKAILSILQKISLDESALACGTDYSYDPELREKRIANHVQKRAVFHNCSGKHACMLAICKMKGWDTRTYYLPDHPVQQRILDEICNFSGLSRNQITVGIDGCGVPVFAMPLERMALMYANLAHPNFSEDYAESCQRICKAMTTYPLMVAGTGQFASVVMQVSQGNILAKPGADGIFCSHIFDRGLSVAVKMEDGNGEVLSLVMMSVYQQLGVLNAQQLEALQSFACVNNKNCRGEVVGMKESIFELEYIK